MKKISILGEHSNAVNMFMLELAWVMSKDKKVYCHLSDKSFYDCFSENDLDCTDIANLCLIKNMNELLIHSNPDCYILTDTYVEESDIIVFAVEQNYFSIQKINTYASIENLPKMIFSYIDFIPSNFDDHYIKNYLFDKRLISNDYNEFYFEFDEKTKIRQIENQLNRLISLKKYPKSRKSELLSLSDNIIEDEAKLNYREHFKILDERISVC